LVEASPAEKRELFENLFELDFVDKAREEAKLYKKEVETKITTRTTELAVVENDLKTKKEQLIKDTELLNNFKSNNKKDIQRLQDKITEEKKSLKIESANLKAT